MKTFLKKLSPQFYFAFILLIIFLLHVSYLNNDFVWLDHGDIESGRTIVPISQIISTFFMRFGDTGFFRPLVTIVNSLDSYVYGTFAQGFHLTNVLLHLIAASLIPLFISSFFNLKLREKFVAVLIFGLHPASWLPVAEISYRSELLLAIFTMLSVYFHSRARQTGRKGFAFLTIVCFLLGLFSKETALVVIPLCFLLWEVIHVSSARTKVKKKKLSLLSSGLFLFVIEAFIIALYLILRFHAVPEVWRFSQINLPLIEAITIRFFVILKLLGVLVLPTLPGLSDAVSITQETILGGELMLFLVLIAGIFIVKKGVRADISKVLLLLAFFLLPALNIVPIPRLGSPHYAYLPSIVFSAGVALLLRNAVKNKKIAPFFFVNFLLWFFVVSINSFLGGFRFQNDYTLFQPEVVKDPQFLEGHFYLGNYFLKQKNFNPSEKEYRLALKPNPHVIAYTERSSALINLAIVYIQENKFQQGESALDQAEKLILQKNASILVHNRALLYYKKHDYNSTVKLLSGDPTLQNNLPFSIVLADSLHQLGRDQEAKKVLEKLLPNISGAQQEEVQLLIERLRK